MSNRTHPTAIASPANRSGTRDASTNRNPISPSTSKSRCSQNEAGVTPFGDDVSIFTRCEAAMLQRRESIAPRMDPSARP